MSQESVSIRQLISDVAKDARHLMQSQAELAKVESKQTQKEAATTGGLFAVAAAAGAAGGLFLLLTIAWGLVALGLPIWAGFGIVTLVLFITAAIAGLVGKKKADQIKPFEATKLQVERTKKALSGAQPSTEVVAAPQTLPQQR